MLYEVITHSFTSRAGPPGGAGALVDADHKVQVYYPEEEYGQAGFMPDWPSLSSLIRPATLRNNFV